MNFDHLSSHALTARLGDLLATERRTIAEFVLHLVEFERRRLHLELGYSSLFVYCVEGLRLTRSSSFRRTEAARLVGRYPEIAEFLRDGRLCLTTLAVLREVLTDETYREILERAAGKTEEQVRELVAALRPQAAPPDLFRRLPAPVARSAVPITVKGSAAAVGAPAVGAPAVGAPADDARSAGPEQGNFANSVPGARAPATLRPISDELRVLRVTVGREFADDLARVKALLGHTIPDGNLEQVLHACIRRTIAACETRRRGAERPRPRKNTQAPAGRGIPTDVRREVWRRDGGSCAFTAPHGKRCGATHRVEFHHVVPFARGGPATVDNIQIRCKPHNQYAADIDFGPDFMRSVISASVRSDES